MARSFEVSSPDKKVGDAIPFFEAENIASFNTQSSFADLALGKEPLYRNGILGLLGLRKARPYVGRLEIFRYDDGGRIIDQAGQLEWPAC